MMCYHRARSKAITINKKFKKAAVYWQNHKNEAYILWINCNYMCKLGTQKLQITFPRHFNYETVFVTVAFGE